MKEEILKFIDENFGGEKYLSVYEVTADGQHGRRTFKLPKEEVKEIIETRFNDELTGKPDEKVEVTIKKYKIKENE